MYFVLNIQFSISQSWESSFVTWSLDAINGPIVDSHLWTSLAPTVLTRIFGYWKWVLIASCCNYLNTQCWLYPIYRLTCFQSWEWMYVHTSWYNEFTMITNNCYLQDMYAIISELFWPWGWWYFLCWPEWGWSVETPAKTMSCKVLSYQVLIPYIIIIQRI